MLQWTSKFTEKMAQSSLGGEVYALSEMANHMSLPKAINGPFEAANPGAVGLKDCGSLCTHLAIKKMVAERFLVRHILSTQRALEAGDLENAYWLPGTESPADGFTKVRSDVVPLAIPLEPGRFYPGQLLSLEGVAWKE